MRHSIVVVSMLAACVLARGAAQSKPDPQSVTPKPVKVKVISLPPASATTEVKVVSLPPASAPTAVRIVEAPKDDSGEKLVASTDRLVGATEKLTLWTAGVFLVTALLAGITFWISKVQSSELARRDKDALAREVNRSAHRLRLDTERTRLLVNHRVDRQTRVGAMMGGGQAALQVFQNARDTEVAQLNTIAATTGDVAGPGVDAFEVLGKLSAAELARRQWTFDRDQALVDVIRDKAQKDIEQIEAERMRYLSERTMVRAAQMGNPPVGAPGQGR